MMQGDDDLYVALRGEVSRTSLTLDDDNIVELSLRHVLQSARRRIFPFSMLNWRLTAVEQMRERTR